MIRHKKKNIYIHANPLAKVLGLHTTKVSYSQKHKMKLQQGGRIYATSAFCSMEGMVASSSAAGGGAKVAVTGVEEVGAKEAAEAAEGEIIDTMAGVNFFAFSKKAFSSKRVRPWRIQSSPNQDLHHAHRKARWRPQHLASQKDLSVGEEDHHGCRRPWQASSGH
jgi:hypothetical protein